MRQQYLLVFTVLACASLLPAQQVTLPLWPNGAPGFKGADLPNKEFTEPGTRIVAGRPLTYVKEVSRPALSVYKPNSAKDTGAAVLVFPGGAYQRLAYDLEGTEVCDWLNTNGMTCVLVKYRVPFAGHYPEVVEDLEDAQQAMRITRSHAAEWRIDPRRIGALGFSAGAHLAVILGNHPDFKREGSPASADDKADARPDFVLVIYPGYLTNGPNPTGVAPSIGASPKTPPTFLLQTEDDFAHVENSLLYYRALKDAKVDTEMHIYAEGGHGYGLRPAELPVSHWSALAETWFHTIGVLGRAR